MTLQSKLKKGTLIAAMSLGITFMSTAPGTTALAASDNSAQQLVDSLNVLKLDHVDYLYAYLQSVNLSGKEYSQIVKNTNRANQIIRNTNDVENLPNSAKVELLRIMMENVKLLQLKAVAIDDKGKPVDLINYRPGTTGLKIQLTDLNGKLLATFDPTLADLNAQALLAKINALQEAVKAVKKMSESGKFVAMPSASLPNTATELPTMIALGGLLVVLGGAALVPAVIYTRKTKQPAGA
ncbi:cell wall anchor protein [Peribacillus deserti]|uniref:Cell wall anchor protein n=1 Tax=Peribacillus deserti TaxID=673318 RepID=A0A2N5M9T7_9BACI|nr:cell wall anchor protein [Peribacillus deserti]PLT31107.1 cell wall anchor protein [Peribacillus deserti]